MWIKGKNVYTGSIILHGFRIFNPSDKQLIEAGYVWKEPEVDNREWVDKELFVNAVYELVPAEAIPAALAEAKTAKAAIAGMALFATGAAPGNSVDISDPRVAQWLAVGGVTVDEVKEKMQEFALNG
jgi:hypothetical protein